MQRHDEANEETGIYHRADVYHAIYEGRGKDYAAEASAVTRHIRDRHPEASSLLDVACGTGSHLRLFAESFDDVEGLDLSADMLTVAKRHVPDVPLHQGDMRAFRLERTFSAITCMFSSVGYLRDVDELDETLSTFASHLSPGGVIVIEPWWFPDTFLPGYVGGDVVAVDGRTISRVSHSSLAGTASRMEVHYTVADPETGIQHFSDTHVMTLFGRDQYEAAFTRAGCSVEYVKSEQTGPGLFVGTREAT